MTAAHRLSDGDHVMPARADRPPAIPVALLGVVLRCPACGELTNAAAALVAAGTWVPAEQEAAKRLAAEMLPASIRDRAIVGEVRQRPEAGSAAGAALRNTCWWCEAPISDFDVYTEALREALADGAEGFVPLARARVGRRRWRQVVAAAGPVPVVMRSEDVTEPTDLDPGELDVPWVDAP